jgi:uncharacterized protein YbjT (DUF2867 family)
MYAVAGVSGNTGRAVAREILGRGLPMRAIVRDPAKGEPWAAQGAEVAVADLADPAALARAFRGAKCAYVLNPPAYTAEDLFSRAEEIAESIARAVDESGLERLIVLSSIGAHLSSGNGIIRTNSLFEKRLGSLRTAVTFLRPAYFMENWAWVAEPASRDGILPSFLAPADRAIPMVAAVDVGRVVADVMMEPGVSAGVIELEGPGSFSPNDAAEAFSRALGRNVEAVPIPESRWPETLASSGFSPRTIEAWTELFRAFNAGRIDFEGNVSARRHGRVTLAEAVAEFVR